jgi:hypothetical protein
VFSSGATKNVIVAIIYLVVVGIAYGVSEGFNMSMTDILSPVALLLAVHALIGNKITEIVLSLVMKQQGITAEQLNKLAQNEVNNGKS